MRIFFFLVIFIFMTLPVSGEYYQYRDADGNILFTDDVANVPANDRSNLTVYESVENFDFETPSNEDESNAIPEDVAEKDAALSDELSSLNELRMALDQTAALLKTEHEELAAQAPGVEATRLQKIEYDNKVLEMNTKMADYKKQHQAYNERVRAYNTRIAIEDKKEDSGEAK